MLTTFSVPCVRPRPTVSSLGMIFGLSLPSTGSASSGSSMPSRRGTEKPQMSASSTPTVKPCAATAAARLTVTELLPTPPLPLATASTRQVIGDLGVGGVLAGVPAGLQHHLAALLAGHLAPLDVHVGDAGVHGDAALDVLLDLGAQRAAADGELHRDHHPAVGVRRPRRAPCRG